MSLIVTSNIALEDRPETSEAFKPYSYQNRLLNTFKIPPNSEIALQSAKINKNGLFVLDRANSGFAHYFGDPQDANLDESTTQPFPAVIGAGEAFRAGGKTELNVDDMADEINKGINRATFHPSLITGNTTTGIVVVPKYSAGLAFEGFQFTCTQQTAKTTRNAASITWTDVSKNNEYNFTQAGGTVTSTDANGFYVQNREYPISQNNGSATFDFSDANTGHWMVGLSRINTQRENALGGWDYLPDYFNDQVSQALLQGVYKKEQFTYADIAVVRQGDNLRVYQSGARTAAGSGDGIYMNEVTYYGGYNASFSEIYDVATNGQNYDKVKFELENEELKIYMIGPDGEGGTNTHLLADFTTLSGAGAVKNECLNPTNAAKWALYPVCAASGGVGGGKDITLDGIDHYTNYPSYSVPAYINYDWWAYSQFNNLTRWCKELEMRDWNNFNRTTSGTLGNGLLTPKGVQGNGMDDYENTLITVKSNVYGEDITANCNTANTLGFVGMPVSQPTGTPGNTKVQIESTSVPKLISNVSLFIRLNNFTQNSVNARQGTNSKIVAHLPRFDNSGNETGGLYFEPHEKTYLKLNNTDELLVNSFDIDFVYDNETLCSALTGKTIVCFHIRDAK